MPGLLDQQRPGPYIIKRVGVAFSSWGGFYSPPAARELEPSEEASDFALPAASPGPSTRRMEFARNRWSDAMPKTKVKVPKEEIEAAAAEVEAEEEEDLVEADASDVEAEPSLAAESVTTDAPEQPAGLDTAITAEEPEPPTSAEPVRLTRREKLLAVTRQAAAERVRQANQAHEHAHSPLPDGVIPRDPEVVQQERAAAKEKQIADETELKATVLGRLRKLWGGTW